MKKILIVSLLSLITFGIFYTMLHETTWSAIRYKFVLGFFGALIPFFIIVIVYHLILQALLRKFNYLQSLFPQICLGIFISLVLTILYMVFEGNYFGSSDSSFFDTLKRDASFILGAGVIISIIYYYVTLFFEKKSD